MAVRRDSLRARSDFFSPMTGNTSGTRFAGERRGSYTEEAKRRLQDLDTGRTDSPVIEAIKVALEKTPDPFTKIPTKKSYAPEEDQGLAGVLEGLGDGAEEEVVKAVGDFIEPITSGGSGQRASQRRADQQFARQEKNPSSRTSTAALVARDNRRYGNTVPGGSFGINSKSTDDFSKDPRYQSTADPTPDPGTPPQTEETRTYYGQGGLPLGTTTIRQGGQVKDGKFVGPQEKGPAINASGFQQKNVRGSTSFDKTGKDESARPKQTIASLPSDYKKKEEAARAVASAYKASKADSQAKGDAAAKATNTPSKPPAGSFGISDKGKAQAAVNKAQAQKKSSPSTSKSSPSTSKSSPSSASKSSTSTSKSQGRGGARGRSSGGSGSSSKGGSKSGGSKSGGSTGRGGSRGGSSGGSGSSSKGGTGKGGTKTSRSASKASKSRTGRSKTRCDIRTKVDISVLTNMDLLKDDLANVAYFVKELQETD